MVSPCSTGWLRPTVPGLQVQTTPFIEARDVSGIETGGLVLGSQNRKKQYCIGNALCSLF